MNKNVFSPVNYRQFRVFLSSINASKVKGKGFETVIYDNKSNIQAIVHAASIDDKGRCFPAEYFIRSHISTPALALVA